MDETSKTIVSHSGTRHIIGLPKSGGNKLHSGRIVALCGFSLREDESPIVEAVRDCLFCESEAAAAGRNAYAAAGQSAIYSLPEQNGKDDHDVETARGLIQAGGE